jgi:glycosyltransferase involved in cell wall biosynthesis
MSATAERSATADADGRTMLMLGASNARVCGVRDYSKRLGRALEERGVRIVDVWWDVETTRGRLETSRAASKWLEHLARMVSAERPDWIVWHYSVFTYGHRGIPIFSRRVAEHVSGLRTPCVGILHEFAYPFGRRGLRGAVQAATHRAALAHVYRSLDAAVVTTEERRRYLEQRRWLSARPLTFLPVCANVDFPFRAADSIRPTEPFRIGVIGFGSDAYAADPVVEAIARFRSGGRDARLVLVGAPGPASPLANLWRASAERHCIAEELEFTGVLDAQRYASAIDELDIALFADCGGPTSRRTTLAAGLAAGKPTIALDGEGTWHELVEARAVVLTPPDSGRIAALLVRLSESADERFALGDRGQAFYQRRQAPHVLAREFLRFLDAVGPSTAVRRTEHRVSA